MSLLIQFVTGNTNKYEELRQVVPGLERVHIDLPEVQAVDSRDVISAKLSEARLQMPDSAILVEDTALHLDCMNGFPGALIKWMLGSIGCQGIYDVCNRMGDYDAEAQTVIGYLAADDSEPRFFDAILGGRICQPAGSSGFGWDTIFVPAGYEVSLAELPESVLRSIKMRRRAAEKLANYLLNG